MKKGRGDMRILKVERGQGDFLSEKPEQQYQPIDEITKDDLLRLLTIVVENEVEMDATERKKHSNEIRNNPQNHE